MQNERACACTGEHQVGGRAERTEVAAPAATEVLAMAQQSRVPGREQENILFTSFLTYKKRKAALTLNFEINGVVAFCEGNCGFCWKTATRGSLCSNTSMWF